MKPSAKHSYTYATVIQIWNAWISRYDNSGSKLDFQPRADIGHLIKLSLIFHLININFGVTEYLKLDGTLHEHNFLP